MVDGVVAVGGGALRTPGQVTLVAPCLVATKRLAPLQRFVAFYSGHPPTHTVQEQRVDRLQQSLERREEGERRRMRHGCFRPVEDPPF